MSISYAKNVGLVKTPPIAKIGDNLYRLVNFNGLQWIAEELKETVPGATMYDVNGVKYYTRDSANAINSYAGNYGFRLPTRTEVDDLFRVSGNLNQDKVKSICVSGLEWYNLGNNSTTFSMKSLKSASGNNTLINNNPNKPYVALINSESQGGWFSGVQISEYTDDRFDFWNGADNRGVIVRLCRDL